jgi:TatD DNase family protein
MKIFDTHCHYNLAPIVDHWRAEMERARANGVKGTLVVGTDLATSVKALELKRAAGDFFRVSVGIHPEKVTGERARVGQSGTGGEVISRQALEKLMVDFGKAWSGWREEAEALGEIGLDFYYDDKGRADFEIKQKWQEELLRAQLQLGVAADKVIILHVRDKECQLDDERNGYGRVLKIVTEEAAEAQLVFHCFSGTLEYLERVLELPKAMVSFAGNLTFKNAGNLRELLVKVPKERLLVETDAPFLSPEPKRGQSCQPWMISYTLGVAEGLGADLELIYSNSVRLFGEDGL